MTIKKIAQLSGKSISYINKVKSGKIKTPDEYVLQLLDENNDEFEKILSNPLLWEVCETAVMRGKTAEVRKFAILVQQINERLRLADDV